MTWQHRFIRGQTNKNHVCLTLFGAITRQPNWNLQKVQNQRNTIFKSHVLILQDKTRQDQFAWTQD